MNDATTHHGRLLPGQPVPDLELPLVGGGTWRLSDRTPEMLTMIEVYRGYHCPLCRNHLGQINERLADFAAAGVEVIAISTDGAERAAKAKAEWDIGGLTVGYDLPIETARRWGLYVSRKIQDSETEIFSEAGTFLVRPDRTLYAAQVGSVPMFRADLGKMLAGLAKYKDLGGRPSRGGE